MGILDLGARPDNKMFIFIYFNGDGGTTLPFALYLELITQDPFLCHSKEAGGELLLLFDSC